MQWKYAAAEGSRRLPCSTGDMFGARHEQAVKELYAKGRRHVPRAHSGGEHSTIVDGKGRYDRRAGGSKYINGYFTQAT